MVNGYLPPGWVWTSLKEISRVIYRYPTFYGMEHLNVGIPVIRGEHIKQDGTISHDWANYWRVSHDISKKFPKTIVGEDDLIMSVRGSIGKVGIVDKALINAQVSPNCIRISTKHDLCLPAYLLYYLKSTHGQTLINKNVNATTIQTIKASSLSFLPIPLPSLPEQERIVERIESLFTQLDTGVAGLKRTQAALKRYKASVLKTACEGRLVPQDPSDEPATETIRRLLSENGKKFIPLDEEQPELPSGWRWVSWEMILANEKGAFRRGPFGSTLKKSIFVKSGYKVYEQYCPINDDCSFGRYFITPEKFYELKSFVVKPGDYLVSCSGVTLGRITRVPEHSEKGIINQALLRVRINDKIIDNNYFIHYFRSQYFQTKLFDSSTGTAIPNVKGVKELKALPIPLPPLEEQHRIVTEIEHQLSVVQELEQTIESNLKRATRLRQAILKRAFEGKLV